MTIEDIAAGLGKELGIELNVVDDSFAMDFGGMPFVVMRLDGERGEMLTVACDLGEIPPQSPGKLYEALLNANWAYRGAAGAVLARNPGDGHIWLQDSLPFASLRVEDLLKRIEALGGAISSWRKIIADYREAVESSVGEAPDLPQDMMMASGMFMSV